MAAIIAFQTAGQRERAQTNGNDDYEYEKAKEREREEMLMQQRIREKAPGTVRLEQEILMVSLILIYHIDAL